MDGVEPDGEFARVGAGGAEDEKEGRAAKAAGTRAFDGFGVLGVLAEAFDTYRGLGQQVVP
ncbi:hypothetical protein ACFVFS_18755 [Kitasatospora sp. NPDC057692]|uniref:hypothetical protein n=1 Tax=Kitasatospora sp. NPDC057692 TaxID=3346215 RepID=UPI00368757A3